jgi:hypothetical protein
MPGQFHELKEIEGNRCLLAESSWARVALAARLSALLIAMGRLSLMGSLGLPLVSPPAGEGLKATRPACRARPNVPGSVERRSWSRLPRGPELGRPRIHGRPQGAATHNGGRDRMQGLDLLDQDVLALPEHGLA